MVGNTAKLAQDLPCVNWNPRTNTDPAGCTWFTTPPDPGDRRSSDPFGTTKRLFTSGTVSAPGESARGGLNWSGDPQLVKPAELPEDRILTGRVRNDSSAPLRLDGATAVLRDEAGRPVRGVVTYAHGFTHGLYGPGVSPKEPMPDFLATRLGTTVVVAPGETVPVTISWRGGAPSSADLGSATLAVPATG